MVPWCLSLLLLHLHFLTPASSKGLRPRETKPPCTPPFTVRPCLEAASMSLSRLPDAGGFRGTSPPPSVCRCVLAWDSVLVVWARETLRCGRCSGELGRRGGRLGAPREGRAPSVWAGRLKPSAIAVAPCRRRRGRSAKGGSRSEASVTAAPTGKRHRGLPLRVPGRGRPSRRVPFRGRKSDGRASTTGGASAAARADRSPPGRTNPAAPGAPARGTGKKGRKRRASRRGAEAARPGGVGGVLGQNRAFGFLCPLRSAWQRSRCMRRR